MAQLEDTIAAVQSALIAHRLSELAVQRAETELASAKLRFSRDAQELVLQQNRLTAVLRALSCPKHKIEYHASWDAYCCDFCGMMSERPVGVSD